MSTADVVLRVHVPSLLYNMPHSGHGVFLESPGLARCSFLAEAWANALPLHLPVRAHSGHPSCTWRTREQDRLRVVDSLR